MRGHSRHFAAAVGAFACAAALSSPVRAKDDDGPEVLEPASPWNLRYDEDKCRLARQFGPEGDHLLLIDQSGMEPFYNITVVGERAKPFRRGLAFVQFGREDRLEGRSFVTGETPDDRPVLTMHGVTLAPAEKGSEGEVGAIGPVRENAIDRIVIARLGKREIDLRTGPMGETFAALRDCAKDLDEYLALNPESGAEDPKPSNNPGRWVTPRDYPERMIRRGQEGLVYFRLTVSSEGRPTACHIIRSTRPQTFDDVVCLALLKRAEFEPALDADGQPRAAYYSNAVRFEMR